MQDIRVVEVSSRVAGSHLGRLLAEQGGETILVEPLEGHPLRERGPFAEGESGTERSLEFAHYHLNKKGVTLDLNSPEGGEVFDRVVETADVLVTDHPPDHPLREDLLAYDRLNEFAPELIVTSITPYGLEGPKRDYAAADITIQAMGGFPQINGHPERPPLQLPNNQTGHMGALNAMIGTLSAIFYREFNGGTGQLVDVSQQEAILIHLEHHLQLETFDGYTQNPLFPDHHVGRRSGRFFTPNVPIGIFPCEDGAVCMAAAQDHEVEAMEEFLGGDLDRLKKEGKLDNPMSNRTKHGIEITEAVEKQASEFKAEELERRGQEAGIAVSMVKNPAELLEDEHFQYNNFIRSVDHPKIGQFEDTGPGARTRTAKNQEFDPAPLLGQHNQDLYQELGYNIEKLREQELI